MVAPLGGEPALNQTKVQDSNHPELAPQTEIAKEYLGGRVGVVVQIKRETLCFSSHTLSLAAFSV